MLYNKSTSIRQEVFMPRFFVRNNQISEGIVTVTGDDAHHLSRSLRMAVGETVVVCDENAREYLCELTDFLPDRVLARVLTERVCEAEPPFFAHVFQALPKGDKLDSIIQKAIECGASALTTFESERCVVRMKDASEGKKQDRRARIAVEAAKQSGRGRLPEIHPTLRFSEAIGQAAECELALFCYEGEGTIPLGRVLADWKHEHPTAPAPASISVVIGSEGGFSEAEVTRARACGMIPIGLGPRILRTETAASFVLSCLVMAFELS
jgi:16S rRNA (uracil1498-N3)-methyltransferase